MELGSCQYQEVGKNAVLWVPDPACFHLEFLLDSYHTETLAPPPAVQALLGKPELSQFWGEKHKNLSRYHEIMQETW